MRLLSRNLRPLSENRLFFAEIDQNRSLGGPTTETLNICDRKIIRGGFEYGQDRVCALSRISSLRLRVCNIVALLERRQKILRLRALQLALIVYQRLRVAR